MTKSELSWHLRPYDDYAPVAVFLQVPGGTRRFEISRAWERKDGLVLIIREGEERFVSWDDEPQPIAARADAGEGEG